jgi:hypothetical protein
MILINKRKSFAEREFPRTLNLQTKRESSAMKSIYAWQQELLDNPPSVSKLYSKGEWKEIVLEELYEPGSEGFRGPHSEESKRLISEAHKGKKQPVNLIHKRSKSRSRQITIDGIKYSSQTNAAEKLNVSKAVISKWKKMAGSSDFRREDILLGQKGENNSFFGKKHSEESKKKMSLAKMGNKHAIRM